MAVTALPGWQVNAAGNGVVPVGTAAPAAQPNYIGTGTQTQPVNVNTANGPQNAQTGTANGGPAQQSQSSYIDALGRVQVNSGAPSLQANFTQPTTTTRPAPTVVTSDAANNNIQNMQNTAAQSNADVANNNAYQSQLNTFNQSMVGTNSNGNTQNTAQNNPQGQTGQNTNGTGSNPQDTYSPADDTNGDPGGYNQQIDSLLNDMMNGSTTASPSAVQQAQINGDTQGLQMDQAVQQQTADSINSINNGTYPLSATEQAQVAQVAQSYNGALTKAQNISTILQGVLAGDTIANHFSPQYNVASMQNVINSAGATISKINTDILDAQSKLTTSLLAGDYKSAQALYTQASNNITKRNTELQNIQNELDKQTTAMNDNVKTAITALGAQRDAAIKAGQFNITQQTKAVEDAATNAYRQGMLSIQEKKLIDTENTTAQTNAIASNPAAATQMNANGTVNTASQQNYLNQLPGGATGEQATLIKGLADYTINPSTLSTSAKQAMGGLTQSQAESMAAQYDPSYDSKSYATRQAAQKSFLAGGTYGQKVTSLNTIMGHLSTLSTDVGKLGNVNFSPYNAVKNAVGPIFGSNPQTGTKLSLEGVTTELASALKASGATQSEIDSLNTLNPNSTPADVKSYIETATSLLSSRLGALDDQYSSDIGKAPTGGSLLTNDAAASLIKLQQSGLNIDTSELDKTSIGKLFNYGKSNPSEQAKISKMENDGVSYDDIAAYYGLQ